MKDSWHSNSKPRVSNSSIQFMDRAQEKVDIDNLEIIRVLTLARIKLNSKTIDKHNSKPVRSVFLMYLELFLMRWDLITRTTIYNK